MVFDEKQLDRIIRNQLSIELASSIEVPNIDAQWEQIRKRIIEDNIPRTQKTVSNRKRLAIAAAILISIGSLNYLYLNNANADGGKVASFLNNIVQKATHTGTGAGSNNQTNTQPNTGANPQNNTEPNAQPNTETNTQSDKQSNNPVLPKSQNSRTIIEKEGTVDQTPTPFPINNLIPSYYAPEFNLRPVVPSSLGTTPINLGSANNYTILAKSGISSVPNSVITGNIGVSPIASTAMTGFSLTLNAAHQFSDSTQVIGKAYAPDYASPTSSYLTTAVNNMETAYTDAASRAVNYSELQMGNISGQTLIPGVYKWGTGVLINSNVTLQGGANDVFIFQISKGITQASGTRIILTGGAQAKNIFMAVSGNCRDWNRCTF